MSSSSSSSSSSAHPPPTKRLRVSNGIDSDMIATFRSLVGNAPTDDRLEDLLMAAKGNLEKAVDLYFSQIDSEKIAQYVMKSRHSGVESIRRLSEPNTKNNPTERSRNSVFGKSVSYSSSSSRGMDLFNWMRGDTVERSSPELSDSSEEGTLERLKTTTTVLGEIETYCMCTRPMSGDENRMKPGRTLNLTCTFKEPMGRRGGNNRKRSTCSLGDRMLRGTAIARLSQPQFSPPSNEVGNLPGSISQVLAPLIMLDMGVSVKARVGSLAAYAGVIGGPVKMGDNIPITLTVMVDSRGLKKTKDRYHLGRYIQVAAEQECVLDRLRDCWWSLITDKECLGLKPLRAAAWNITDVRSAAPSPEAEASPNAEGTEDEELDEAEGEMSAQMQEVLKTGEGSTEYLARLDLPGMYPPPGVMACELKPYQAQALGWMMKREWPVECGGLPKEATALYADPVDPEEPVNIPAEEITTLHPSWAEFLTRDENVKLYLHASRAEASVEFPGAAPDCLGGILADEMGLGKTVMALSLIATDRWLLDQGIDMPPKPQANKEASNVWRVSTKATLIVLPLSLLNQWQSEAVEHMGDTKTFGKPFQYYGNERIKSVDELVAIAERSGLVMTTYGVVARDGPDIFKHIRWRRIVLDECHLIKSRVTAISRVVRTCLHGERLWCLSGTPVQNTLEDLFPIIQFLHMEPWNSFAFYKRHIVDPVKEGDQAGRQALHAMLSRIMIRRTKETKDLTGQPLVQMPDKLVRTLEIPLDEDEERIYTYLFWRSQLEFNSYLEHSENLHRMKILNLILRLRQALCHPILCLPSKLAMVMGKVPIEDEDGSSRPADNGGVAENLDELYDRFMGESASKDTSPSRKEYLKKVIDGLKVSESLPECVICLETLTSDNLKKQPVLTVCGHTMCKPCASASIKRAGTCPVCRAPVSVESLQVIPTQAMVNAVSLTQSTDEDQPQDETGLKYKFRLSSKMMKLLRYVKRDVRRGWNVVIFSQWTSYLWMISHMLDLNQVPYRLITGKQNQNERQANVAWFNHKSATREIGQVLPDCHDSCGDVDVSDPEDEGDSVTQGKVLLVSLRAGGVGLNLTAGRTLYLMDLWWNPAVEEQAMMRVHRLGQQHTVRIYRFVVRDSIDQRIMDLQGRKSRLTNMAFDASDAAALQKDESRSLTLEEMKMLFKPGTMELRQRSMAN
ncbi:DNA helicase rad5 [Perkinsus chesapeaki]|uniref:DNA helicase rad5 n=1 Tax=Perkinsus chesapeaki TaxID=330153 RepID=A0A7J6LPP7_PERCH|nr:DNA helicase rad5 [Perkinsus chesapeaki]